MIEDRLQSSWVGQLVEVGEGTFTEFPHGEMISSLSSLTEILNGSQGSQGGVKEGEEVSNKDIIEEELAISVRILFAELADEPFEGTNMLGPEDRLGPDGQITPDELRRARELGSFGRWDRVGESLLGGHNRIL